jgi:hypothetical protein
MDPRNYVFGFGRRICPGQHLVDASLWLLIACMIATLDIGKAKDNEGHDVDPVIKYPNSVFRQALKLYGSYQYFAESHSPEPQLRFIAASLRGPSKQWLCLRTCSGCDFIVRNQKQCICCIVSLYVV